MYTQMVCREALGKCGETEKPDDAALPAGRLNATAVLIRTGACGQEEEEEELLAVAPCSGRDAVFGSHFLILEGEASSLSFESAGRST